MGLDHNLTKKTYVKNWDHMKPEQRHQVTVLRAGKPVPHIDPDKVAYIEEDIIRWRKANHIHAWFVENVQDGNDNCAEYYVTVDDLKRLLDICERIIEECPLVPGKVQNGSRMIAGGGFEPIMEDGMVMTNTEVARSLLPTAEGFFFGSTDYDQWYMRDVKHTAEELRKVVDAHDTGADGGANYYYHSSW